MRPSRSRITDLDSPVAPPLAMPGFAAVKSVTDRKCSVSQIRWNSSGMYASHWRRKRRRSTEGTSSARRSQATVSPQGAIGHRLRAGDSVIWQKTSPSIMPSSSRCAASMHSASQTCIQPILAARIGGLFESADRNFPSLSLPDRDNLSTQVLCPCATVTARGKLRCAKSNHSAQLPRT